MNRSDLIEEVAHDCGLEIGEARRIITTFCDSLVTHLANGDSIHLWGFGKFEPRLRKAHQKFNPLVDQVITIPERVSITFVPSGRMKKMLNPRQISL